MDNNDKSIVGYSAFRLYDECYEYNENACYIADSPESLRAFLEGASFNLKDYRIDTIKLAAIIEDYGCSSGEFAMEPEALKRFKQVTKLTYSVEPFDDPFNDGDPDLFVVNIDSKNVSKDNKEFTIPEILASFRMVDGVYKHEQVDAAVKIKDEITPHLVEILENVRAEPEKYAGDYDLYEHIYAVMLLGYFKASKAHKVIVDLFSLPNDLPDQMFGDIAASGLPVILLNTCDGSVELIKSMILNKEADVFCRTSACHALAYAVIEGYVSRESVIEFFGTLFTGDEADDTSDFWSILAAIVCDLYPKEIMDVIKQAYTDELITPGIIEYSQFKNTLELGKDKCLEELKNDFKHRSMDNIHAFMSWSACFNEEPKAFSSSTGFEDDYFSDYSEQPARKSVKNKKKAKKKKRKQAKASRRKNRL
jgi:hypothetical protein